MLIPEMYGASRPEDIIETVRGNPLAMVVTNGGRTPYATHVPVIVHETVPVPGEPESLAGATLLGHMNRGNDHWDALQGGGHILIVFQGPDAYISPMAYEKRPAAPTWNFITVHLRGRVETIEAGEPTLDVITKTVTALENVAGTGWDMTGSLDYFRNIQPRVGAFRVHVESVEAMFKLSQEHAPETRRSIREHLSAKERGTNREVSEAMWSAELAAEDRDHASRPNGKQLKG